VRCARAGFEVWVDPQAKLIIHKNLKNADVLGGQLSWQRLRWMFRYPSGPTIRPSSSPSTRDPSLGPGGRGFLRALLPGKLGVQLLLNLLGLGRRLRAMKVLFIHNRYRLRAAKTRWSRPRWPC